MTHPRKIRKITSTQEFKLSEHEIPEILREVTTLDGLIEIGMLYNQTCRKRKQYDDIVFKLYRLIPTMIKLRDMIGMTKLKEEIVKQILFFVQDLHIRDEDGNLFHTVIQGPPGCGKTSVAQLIGDIYRNLGFLKNDKFVIAKQGDLIGEYIGQTAPRTEKVLKSALGGVIFIDEVYSLSAGEKEHTGYSKECIDTLNQFLSENKKDIVCIIAGYKEDINKRFFAMNKGLERRFPYRYEISPYSHEDLYRIFLKQVLKNQWKIKDEDKKRILELFDDNVKLFNFGGGDTENLLTLCKTVHSYRVFKEIKSNKFALTYSDVLEGIEQLKKSKEHQTDDFNKPPECLYI